MKTLKRIAVVAALIVLALLIGYRRLLGDSLGIPSECGKHRHGVLCVLLLFCVKF